MELLATTEVHIKNVYDGPVEVKLWTKADPFPPIGAEVGVDTETELITETNLGPPLVVLGCFDPASATCYIVYWEDAAIFINQLSKREITQYYFNLGFDEIVEDNEDNEKALLDAIEAGRVRDMQIRIQLHDIATIGYIPWNHWSLEDCSRLLLGIELDKGEKDDLESHRLTFRRGTPITEKQAVYLAWDCISTYGLSCVTPAQATEVTHTKGMVVLAHISYNGFPIDQRVFDAFELKLQKQRDEYRLKLLDFGFPDPYKKDQDENGDYRRFVEEQARAFCMLTGNDKPLNLCKANMRMALVYAYNFEGSPGDVHDFEESVAYWLTLEKPKNLRKNEEKLYKDMVDELDLFSFMAAGKEIVLNALIGHILEDLLQTQQATKESNGYNLAHAVEHASEILDANPHWLSSEKQVGPQTYLQDHIEGLLKQHPELELDRTEKSGKWKLTLKDMWRLEDADIKDPFMEVYTGYCHCTKYLSTYLNRSFVKEDGKIHAKFTNLMKTGRTSCTRPNLQNLPSRDKQYPLKNMFRAPEGAILCATDFSFIELCGFAETCFLRFGHSTMREVINAGLDPHRWFAGVMNKIIDSDLTHATDPAWVKQTNAFLKEHVSDTMRQHAKAANFGFPGALGVKTYLRNCREQGIKMTLEEAELTRSEWITAFSEMTEHMRPEKAKNTRISRNAYGMERHEADEEEEEDDGGGHDYMAKLPCGQIRNRCSYNAACNTQFQGTVALGAKAAGWNLVYNGYGDRLLNFVHDEYLYWLWPHELKTHIPRIESLMIAGMKQYIGSVKVGVETTCMLHWNKKAPTLEELQWSPDGLPILEDPPFVKELLTKKGA